MRIACLSLVKPSSTGAGGPIIAYSVGESFLQANCQIIYIVAEGDTNENYTKGKNIFSVSADKSGIGLAAILRAFQADLVWITDTLTWSHFEKIAHLYPHILYSIDPPWEITKLRQAWGWKSSNYIRQVLEPIIQSYEIWKSEGLEKSNIQAAARRGLVVSCLKNDLGRLSALAKTEVAWAALPFIDLKQVNSHDSKPPIALMLGHWGSTHTRFGLKYFFESVWPLWEKNPPDSLIRVVGGGKLPQSFQKPQVHPSLNWVGFVEDLEEEWSCATMLLVPVNVKEGIRSRIIESWLRGVPIISHPSAEIGLPEMKDKYNYLAATTGEEWLAAVRLLEKDKLLAQELIFNGRTTFEKVFSPMACQESYLKLAQLAFDRFHTNLPRNPKA